ncbi:MAG: hypothetical protein V7L23_12410 [Nostoc sp.]|uniref:hypothetical protein n=1 Tax=Nostoc sp. TaxID=1180 RepID=UPI002FF2F7C8
MTRILDLSTETNWQLMYSVSIPATVIATTASKTYYAKITPIRPGVILDKAVLGININTTVPTGKQWVYAGSVSRFTASPLGEVYIDDRKALFLGRFNLVISDILSNNYQVQINIPSWFSSCNLAIYQYEGENRTLIQQELDAIKAAVIPGS